MGTGRSAKSRARATQGHARQRKMVRAMGSATCRRVSYRSQENRRSLAQRFPPARRGFRESGNQHAAHEFERKTRDSPHHRARTMVLGGAVSKFRRYILYIDQPRTPIPVKIGKTVRTSDYRSLSGGRLRMRQTGPLCNIRPAVHSMALTYPTGAVRDRRFRVNQRKFMGSGNPGPPAVVQRSRLNARNWTSCVQQTPARSVRVNPSGGNSRMSRLRRPVGSFDTL